LLLRLLAFLGLLHLAFRLFLFVPLHGRFGFLFNTLRFLGGFLLLFQALVLQFLLYALLLFGLGLAALDLVKLSLGLLQLSIGFKVFGDAALGLLPLCHQAKVLQLTSCILGLPVLAC